MIKTKYTKYDFSKHELIVTQNEWVQIHFLKLPNTTQNSIKFINCEGILTVTGDYGNWVFCRSFIPSADDKEGADVGYWGQKLRIHSVQDNYLWDQDKVIEEVDLLLKNDDYDFTEENIEELNSLKECSSYEEYIHVVYTMRLEYEYIPRGKIINPRLLLICDAFNEICNRLEKEQKQND